MVDSPPKVPVKAHVLVVVPEPPGLVVELAPGEAPGPGPELAV